MEKFLRAMVCFAIALSLGVGIMYALMVAILIRRDLFKLLE